MIHSNSNFALYLLFLNDREYIGFWDSDMKLLIKNYLIGFQKSLTYDKAISLEEYILKGPGSYRKEVH